MPPREGANPGLLHCSFTRIHTNIMESATVAVGEGWHYHECPEGVRRRARRCLRSVSALSRARHLCNTTTVRPHGIPELPRINRAQFEILSSCLSVDLLWFYAPASQVPSDGIGTPPRC